jgi:hypothetical protein
LISIEVVIPSSTVDAVYPVLVQCCAEAGDVLLGRRDYSPTGEVLGVVHLTDDSHVSEHLPILTQALEQKDLLSFQFVQECLVKVAAPGIWEQMANFPFALGDVLIPSLNDERSAYLCLHRRLLTTQQSAWLLAHREVTYSYL